MDVTLVKGANAPEYRRDENVVASKDVASIVTGVVSNESETSVVTQDPVRRAEEAIGAFFEDESNPSGRFSIDQDIDSGRFVYRLINEDTGEVLKQFPGDYVLRRVAFYRELEGIAVDSEV